MRFVDAKDWDGISEHKYAHLKRDGLWLTLCSDASGTATAWSRTPRLMSGLDWHPEFNRFALCVLSIPKTVAYCELFAVTTPDDTTGQVMPRESVKGMLKTRDPRLKIECFAVDQFCGEFVHASTPLDKVERLACNLGLPFVPWRLREELEHELMSHGRTLKDIPTGGEGYMLKDGNTLNWRKVKPRITVDLLCVGFVPGKGKYEGQIGAMRLADSTGKEVTQVSGMTDDERKSMTYYPDLYIGCVVEVEAQAKGSAGGLMHPRYNGLRSDKLPTELDTL